MRCYIAPDDSLTIEDIVVVINSRNQGDEHLMAKDVNEDLANPEGTTREEDIATALAAASLEDTSAHFLPRCKPW